MNSEQIKALPKIELHSHLELCLRPSTIKELAPQFGIELNDEKDFENRFLILEPMQDLGSVLNKFLDTQKLLATEDILTRIAFEACEDAFTICNTRLLELRYAPTFIQQGHPHLTFEKIHQSILRGIEKAESTYPMGVGLICIIQRILPVHEAERVTDFAIENKDTFIGLDLADNEVGFDSKPFSPFFLKAKKAGLRITVHSGEAPVEKAPEYVRDAIEFLGAERIGHGVQIYKDPKMIDYVRSKKITLELCPTSNWLTQAVKSKADHPFRLLFEAGLRTTINTDDGGIFNVNLNQEFQMLHDLHQFSQSEFEQCTQFAFEACFIDEKKKKQIWQNLQ